MPPDSRTTIFCQLKWLAARAAPRCSSVIAWGRGVEGIGLPYQVCAPDFQGSPRGKSGRPSAREKAWGIGAVAFAGPILLASLRGAVLYIIPNAVVSTNGASVHIYTDLHNRLI